MCWSACLVQTVIVDKIQVQAFSSMWKEVIVTGSVALTFGVAGTFLFGVLHSLITSKLINKSLRKVRHKVLFFPDCAALSKNNTKARYTSETCISSHTPSAFTELIQVIQCAQQCIDVCVFAISCNDLSNELTKLHKKGVVVRVITDGQQMTSSGNDIGKLRSAGIQVRHNNSSSFMHHKFMIIDGAMLVNGSFNWTQQAVLSNNENLLITNDMEIVMPYVKEFEKLWEKYKLISRET